MLVAFLLGWPSPLLPPSGAERSLPLQAVIGVCSAAPMMGAFALLDRHSCGWLSGLRDEAARLATALFRGATTTQLLLVSVAAGIGEEVLFRGLLIGSLIGGTGAGALTALVASSALFGLAHPISRSYALVAGIVGVYLGLVYLGSGSLVAPIIAHALYDFFALWRLLSEADAETLAPAESGERLDETEAAGGQSPEDE